MLGSLAFSRGHLGSSMAFEMLNFNLASVTNEVPKLDPRKSPKEAPKPAFWTRKLGLAGVRCLQTKLERHLEIRHSESQAFVAAKKHNRCIRPVLSLSSMCSGGLWQILLFLIVCCRIGEAAVPGPTDHVRLGVCNPGGISSKAALFALQEADAWVVSETHLTSIGLRAFRKELVALASPFKWVVHSKPVAPRSEVSSVGKWSGVAVIGKCPTRPIVRNWTDAQHDSCRIVAASSFCRGLWITGVGVYGCPVGPTHPHARASTESLLDLAVQRVQQSVGCRYVAGDWNGNHTDFKAIEKLRSMGMGRHSRP